MPHQGKISFSDCNTKDFLQVIPRGLASRSGLRVGDRILEVNSIDLRHATHQEAVNALLSNTQELTVVVRRDPPPPGMQVSSEQGLHFLLHRWLSSEGSFLSS